MVKLILFHFIMHLYHNENVCRQIVFSIAFDNTAHTRSGTVGWFLLFSNSIKSTNQQLVRFGPILSYVLSGLVSGLRRCECALNGITILQNSINVMNGGYNFKLRSKSHNSIGKRTIALFLSVLKSHHYTFSSRFSARFEQ